MQRLAESGGDLSRVSSVASFFVSRVDTEADKRLDEIGGHDDLKGKLAIANARLAYQTYKEIFSGSDWEALAAKGASPQRCLWASTSTKDPSFDELLYVDSLVAPETVNTMPDATLAAVLDHGSFTRSLLADDATMAHAAARLSDLPAQVSLNAVTGDLERDGAILLVHVDDRGDQACGRRDLDARRDRGPVLGGTLLPGAGRAEGRGRTANRWPGNPSSPSPPGSHAR